MNWILFPLYGLTITEPDAWLAEPLFEDSTLVSREALRAHLTKTVDPRAVPLLSHGKLSDALGPKMADIGPVDRLVEIEPASYIAVRDKKDLGKTTRRATEIRTLLSATLALRGLRIQSLSGNPSQVAWFIAPREIILHASKAPATNIAPVFNEHVLRETLEVTQTDIRKSLKDGTPIPNSRGWYWDLHGTHPVCQLFLSKVTDFQKRLLNMAIQIQEAGCAAPYETQIQGAVAALEVLLKPESFKELRKAVKAFFPGGDQASRIERLVSVRHRITHEGTSRGEDETNKVVAQHGLMMAWTLLDIATAFEKAGFTTAFDDYVRMLIASAELDEKLGRVGHEGPEYRGILREKFPTFFNFLTIRHNAGSS